MTPMRLIHCVDTFTSVLSTYAVRTPGFGKYSRRTDLTAVQCRQRRSVNSPGAGRSRYMGRLRVNVKAWSQERLSSRVDRSRKTPVAPLNPHERKRRHFTECPLQAGREICQFPGNGATGNWPTRTGSPVEEALAIIGTTVLLLRTMRGCGSITVSAPDTWPARTRRSSPVSR